MYSGFGKVIVFGEHFVVFGIPAIASAIEKYTSAKVRKTDRKGIKIIDNRPGEQVYKNEKLKDQRESVDLILKKFDINTSNTGIEIILEGDLPGASGIGASAASCVAIARSLAGLFDRNLSDTEVNEIAFEGEKGYHGTPSGIDNTVSTFGSLIWFKKGEPNTIERINLEKPIEIVMADTGIVANTKAAVSSVRENMLKDRQKYDLIFKESTSLILQARDAFAKFDLSLVGKLLNKNHELLQGIGVSHSKLDEMVRISLDNGALGAKMTGGGLGGFMFALTPGAELQNNISKALRNTGAKIIKTRIGIG
jgi:mevalonate kinase